MQRIKQNNRCITNKTPKRNEYNLPRALPWTTHAKDNLVLVRARVQFSCQLNTSHCLRTLPRLPDLTPTRPSRTTASAKAR